VNQTKVKRNRRAITWVEGATISSSTTSKMMAEDSVAWKEEEEAVSLLLVSTRRVNLQGITMEVIVALIHTKDSDLRAGCISRPSHQIKRSTLRSTSQAR